LRIGHHLTREQIDIHRNAGWKHVHVTNDDALRVLYCQILPDEETLSASVLLRVTVVYYAALGVTLKEVMISNGHCYSSKDLPQICSNLRLRLLFTKPATQRTNGKTTRLILSSLRDRGPVYGKSHRRIAVLRRWLHSCICYRPPDTCQRRWAASDRWE
jgi:hypothetical protein